MKATGHIDGVETEVSLSILVPKVRKRPSLPYSRYGMAGHYTARIVMDFNFE